MDGDSRQPKIGQIVEVLKGRDAGKLAVILSVLDERFVMIADGDKRKFDQPKKKNLLHLKLYDRISSEVASSLSDTGRVTNGKLRYAVQSVLNEQNGTHEKGD